MIIITGQVFNLNEVDLDSSIQFNSLTLREKKTMYNVLIILLYYTSCPIVCMYCCILLMQAILLNCYVDFSKSLSQVWYS